MLTSKTQPVYAMKRCANVPKHNSHVLRTPCLLGNMRCIHRYAEIPKNLKSRVSPEVNVTSSLVACIKWKEAKAKASNNHLVVCRDRKDSVLSNGKPGGLSSRVLKVGVWQLLV